MAKLHQILNLFKIAPEQYQVNTSLTLDSQMVLEQFLPQFKEYFQKIKASEPQTISKYKIASAPILESTARETLKKYISDVNDILLSENLKELTESWKALVEFIILLSGQIKSIEKFPLFYKDILKSKERINTFLSMPEISDNKTLASKLNMIREGIELYARYHRNESVLALIAFKKECKTFLNN